VWHNDVKDYVESVPGSTRRRTNIEKRNKETQEESCSVVYEI